MHATEDGLCAGNVTQKKWTCSIKALPRGKDPRSIGKWFYDSGIRKAKRLGSAIVGHTIWVLWPSESTFFRGIVTCYDADQGLHVVKYDDGVPLSPLHSANFLYGLLMWPDPCKLSV